MVVERKMPRKMQGMEVLVVVKAVSLVVTPMSVAQQHNLEQHMADMVITVEKPLV